MIVLPVELAATFVVAVAVPDPFGAYAVSVGQLPRFVKVPFSPLNGSVQACDWHVKLSDPVVESAVAPLPPLPVSPYVTSTVPPAARSRLETVIVWPDTDTVPFVEVV